jgi:hypothetical protein
MFVLEEAVLTCAIDDLARRSCSAADFIQPLKLDRVGAQDEPGADKALRCQ